MTVMTLEHCATNVSRSGIADYAHERSISRDCGPRRSGLLRCRHRPGLRRGEVRRLADYLRPGGERLEDVTRIKAHPLVPAGIPVYGYIYDVATGRLVEVHAATAAGSAG